MSALFENEIKSKKLIFNVTTKVAFENSSCGMYGNSFTRLLNVNLRLC